MSVEPEIITTVKAILEDFGTTYVTASGQLKKSKVVQDLENYTPLLMEQLLSNDIIRKGYLKKIADTNIFQLSSFIEMFEYKQYWDDSYTKFSNKIGLTVDGKFLDETADVTLDFPFKDTVLKASMKKEHDQNRKEPFLNETIAKTEIDELLEPKIFVKVKRYDINGEHPEQTIKSDDNLIIKGNNLIALHSLKERYGGQIKLIYLDPPYNTGSDSFVYNDNFNHASWLTFMLNRLQIAKDLLSDDGMIFIQTDDNEQAYLKVLMDSVFGREKYLNTVTIKSKSSSGASGGGEDKKLKKNTEFITIYQNELAQINIQEIIVPLEDYIHSRKQDGKGFAYKSVLTKPGITKKIGETVDGRGNIIELFDVENFEIQSVTSVAKKEQITEQEVYKKYLNQIFTTENAQTSIRERVKNALPNDSGYTIARYVPVSGRNKGMVTDVGFIGKTKRLVSFLNATAYKKENVVYKTEKSGTLWDDISWAGVSKEGGGVSFDSGEKPEKLLQRIIASATQENDIVLDFFMGSATTQAVAMKMHRRFIGIDQMDYINTVSVPRLKNVILGEQGGISKETNWHGGGSFVYAELFEKNQIYVKNILKAKTVSELDTVFQSMKNVADFDFRVDLNNFKNKSQSLEFSERQSMMLKILDINQLYYNYSEIEDSELKSLLKKEEISFNREFYNDMLI
ncbi:site-specific DNA-methyltransferase [Leuconostoc mesenteroides]|uniref:site-specific DNA-methyltransferase n=1 Tax=Leuconostoc mesenteroides TaxID=1245 RepID=UPI0020730C0F|nr:site-specific DNA-methyltransferase [Leuconostoc mesenteroides]MCM6832631.1 site-specific DNA-methyltransferase [Leuconostoc mesenteroides]